METNEITETTFEDLACDWIVDEAAIRVWAENEHMTAETAQDYQDYFYSAYVGEMSLSEFAEELVNENVTDEWALRYIDYSAVVRDLECDGWWEAEGHLFRPA